MASESHPSFMRKLVGPPPALKVTILDFSGCEIVSKMYPEFGLVRHRPQSVFVSPGGRP